MPQIKGQQGEKNVAKNLWTARPGFTVKSFQIVREWLGREFLTITYEERYKVGSGTSLVSV